MFTFYQAAYLYFIAKIWDTSILMMLGNLWLPFFVAFLIFLLSFYSNFRRICHHCGSTLSLHLSVIAHHVLNDWFSWILVEKASILLLYALKESLYNLTQPFFYQFINFVFLSLRKALWIGYLQLLAFKLLILSLNWLVYLSKV